LAQVAYQPQSESFSCSDNLSEQMMKLLCFAWFHLLHVSTATVADEEVDESCALQLRGGRELKPEFCEPKADVECPGSGVMCAGNQCCPRDALSNGLTFPCPSADASFASCENNTKVDDCLKPEAESPLEERDSGEPTYFLSIFASDATLKVENTETKDQDNSWGSLTMTGRGVEKAMVMADRPARKVFEMKTEKLVSELQAISSSGDDFPNAVLSGKVKGAGMKEVTLVLVGANYSDEGPTLTLKWRSDDDIIKGDLDFDGASLFVDSFFCHLIHLDSVIKNELCKSLAGKLVQKGVGKVTCAAEDLAAAGICVAADVEDAEVGLPFCEGAVVGICQEVVAKLGEIEVKEISGGHISIENACSGVGLGDPCGGPRRRRRDHRRRRTSDRRRRRRRLFR